MYDFTVRVRNKDLKFRKWKVKDRNKFKNAYKIKAEPHVFEEALVFDCLEDQNVTLTPEEYKYVMLQIRKESVGPSLHYDMKCQVCTKDYQFDIDIDDAFRPKVKDYGLIKSGDVSLLMGEIQNKEYYKEEVSKFTDEEERQLFDFLMHVKELNGSDSFTFEELFQFVNEMSIDDADSVFDQWSEMKFNLVDKRNVSCPHCNSVELIQFDIMPGFLPLNWTV